MSRKGNKIRLHKVVFDLVVSKSLDFTRPEVQRNIEDFGVYLNGDLEFSRLAWVNPVDHIDFSHWPQRDHGPIQNSSVVHENQFHYIFYKPAGVVIEAGAGHKEDNFVSWMIEHFPDQIELGEENKFGLVHRLDKDTEGLVLVAKTKAGYDYYKSLFKSRAISKKYLTVLNGQLLNQQEVITWNVRDNNHPTRQKAFWSELEAQKYDPQYRRAVSVFRPLLINDDKNQSLVEVTLLTGRMHQIRLQAESIGYPLLSDPKYNKRISSQTLPDSQTDISAKKINQGDFNLITRQLFNPLTFSLLANLLEFEEVNGEHIRVEYRPLADLLSTLV